MINTSVQVHKHTNIYTQEKKMSFITRVISTLFGSERNDELKAYFRSEYKQDYDFAYSRFLETRKLH